MSDIHFYYCNDGDSETMINIQCPCCHSEARKISPADELLRWLKVHIEARKLIYNANKDNYDYGYLVACNVFQDELKRLIQEHKDDSDRVRRD